MPEAPDGVLAGLDAQQREAACLASGPAQIVAPAGSGKTATLVARIGVLLARGVAARRILVVTFNRDAAAELSLRIEAALRGASSDPRPEVRTLHALARQVLLDAGLSARVLPDRLPLLRLARRQLLSRLPPEGALPSAEELDGELSAILIERRPVAPVVAEVAATYQGLLATRGLIDFDGLMVTALERLRADAGLRRRWQARYEHVLVDEFQDVDPVQLELVGLLAEPELNLFVVGDDDQTIYAWRLADVRRMLDFPIRYPEARRIVLETNYRCPPEVVRAAGRLIACNAERVPKRLRAGQTGALARGAGLPSAPISVWPMRGIEAEDRFALALARWGATTEVAVLARTRGELVPVSLALLRAGVPHRSSVPAPLDAEVVRQLVDDLRRSPPGALPLPALLAARASRGWRRADADDRLGEEEHAALDAAIGWAVGFRRSTEYLSALDEARARLDRLRRPDANLELTTVHGAKGRQWPVVVVLGLEAERFPNRRSLAEATDPARALEEERRLAYVAVTRCRVRLVLAFDPDRPSPFVGELLGGVSRRAPRLPSPTGRPRERPR